MDAATSLISIDLPGIEEKDGLPVEAFAKVQEIFSNVDWLDPKTDVALNVLQRIASSNTIQKLGRTTEPTPEEPTPEKLKSENNIKSPTSVAQGKHGSASAYAAETDKLLPQSIPVKLKSEPKESGNNIKSSTSADQGKHGSASADSAETGKFLPESIPAKLKAEPKESGNDIKSPTYVAFREQSMSNFEPSPDANLSRKKIEPQELQVALQRPAQSKFITQRVHKASPSAPVSYCSSLQGSPVPMSRYQSAPSALGITALLHDHAASNSEEEITHPVTVSPPFHSTSALDLTLPKSVQPGQLSIPTPPPLSLSLSPSPSSLQSSVNTTVAKTPVNPPPLPAAVPQQTSNSPHSLLTQDIETTLQGRGQSALVSPSPPPPPSLSGASPSSFVKNSVSNPPPPPPPSSPPPAPPLPSFFQASLPSSLKNSVSVPLPPPPPPSFRGTSSIKNSVSAPTHPSFPGTSSSVKNSLSAPPPFSGRPSSSTAKTSIAAPPPPPPPPPGSASSAACPTSSVLHMEQSAVMSGPPPPPPPPLRSRPASTSAVTAAPPPPPPPAFAAKESLSKISAPVPPVPPPPLPNGVSKTGGATPTSPSRASNGNVPSIPGPPSGVPFSAKGRGLSRANSRNQAQPKKANLKPYHWLKLTRAMQGSLWAEAQKADEATKYASLVKGSFNSFNRPPMF